jgi:hypothetical protein
MSMSAAAATATVKHFVKPIWRGEAPPAPALTERFEWTRSDCIALAFRTCTKCCGAGLTLGARGRPAVCNCVLRSIFRIVLNRYMRCVKQERHLSHVSTEPSVGRSRPSSWGRKDEEYIADVTLVSRRTLSASEWRLFRLHFMLGEDWKICTRKLGIDRGNFFHSVYRIEQKLGRVFREVQPYALFPVAEYFHGPSRLAATNHAGIQR